jgi:hypothetical protein
MISGIREEVVRRVFTVRVRKDAPSSAGAWQKAAAKSRRRRREKQREKSKKPGGTIPAPAASCRPNGLR